MTTHSIHPYDLEDIGRNGYGSINCKIKGYWSSNPITLYINREGWNATNPQWKVTMSHSSGGRDPKEVESDMEAAINFAEAMRDLAIIGRDLILTYGDTLEFAYQVGVADRKREWDAERDALAARLEADPAMGQEAAAALIDMMAHGHLPVVSYYKRASERADTIQVIIREKTRFFINKQPVSKKAATEALAELSMRRLTNGIEC